MDQSLAGARRLRGDPVWRPWIKAWLGASAIGIANGALREMAFRDMSELRAHQLSTATLLGFLTAYMWTVERRRPLPSTGTALQIGAAWAALTVAFEFALGLLITGESLDDLLRNYDVKAGHFWVLVPLWMAVGPAALMRRR